MKSVSWAAILTALLMGLSLVAATLGLLSDDYSLLAMGGIFAANGVGWAVLSLRDN